MLVMQQTDTYCPHLSTEGWSPSAQHCFHYVKGKGKEKKKRNFVYTGTIWMFENVFFISQFHCTVIQRETFTVAHCALQCVGDFICAKTFAFDTYVAVSETQKVPPCFLVSGSVIAASVPPSINLFPPHLSLSLDSPHVNTVWSLLPSLLLSHPLSFAFSLHSPPSSLLLYQWPSFIPSHPLHACVPPHPLFIPVIFFPACTFPQQ